MKKKSVIVITVLTIILSGVFLLPNLSAYWVATTTTLEKLKIFQEVFLAVTEKYVEEKDPINLIDDAIDGMLDNLDPHSMYLNEDQNQRMKDNFTNYAGIGISFRVIRDKITVLEVMDDGPSEKVGLMPGDRIIGINSEDAIGIAQEDVPAKLKGPKGTKVSVTVEREGWETPKEITIIRDVIIVPSVSYHFLLEGAVGYIEISRFTENTVREFERALQQLENQGMKKLVLDLRNDTGGYLQAAVGIVDRFIPANKTIVYTKGRTGESNITRHSTDKATHPFTPLIVLINNYSASASEIVAGAIQDWDRGLIIGTRSFGKGLVQTPIDFSDGTRLLLTTAKYYTPSGRLIQRDYKGKTDQEYNLEARDDSLYQVYLEEAMENDSLQYRTLIAGRLVFGGGGINPDHRITADVDTAFRRFLGKNIWTGNEDPFFTFADRYAEQHTDLKADFQWYKDSFEVSESILQEFYRVLQEIGTDLAYEDLAPYYPQLKFRIKKELAGQLWSRQEKKQIDLTKDDQFKRAITYFPDAETLLDNYYASYIITE